jgi:hypothetical protein
MYPALDINVAEKFFVLPVFSAHVRNPPAIRESQFTDLFKKFFSSLLERFRNDAWSLYGLQKAQLAQHHDAAAAATEKRLRAALVGDVAGLDLARL